LTDVEPRYRLVLELARSVTARRDVEDVLSATFAGLRQILPFAGGSIQLLDDEGWIRMAATEPAAPADVLALRIPLGSTVGGRVILTERPVYIADVLADPAIPAERRKEHLSPGGVRSYLGVPLMADGRAIGLIQIDSPEPEAWSDEERLLLMSIGPIVGAAIQNAKAYALHADAVLRAGQLEERQGKVDQAVVQLIERDLEAVRALVAGPPSDLADATTRLRSIGSQLDRVSAVLKALLSPDAEAELVLPPATTEPPRAPAPRVGEGMSAPSQAPRHIVMDPAPPSLSTAL
jgi:GAF domain-containing protein